MTSYKELGLVNTREMFAKAVAGGYAIPAFNFNTLEQMQAIVQAAVETKSPVIMQVSKGARNYANGTILRYMAQGAVEYAKELGCENPQIVLHLRTLQGLYRQWLLKRNDRRFCSSLRREYSSYQEGCRVCSQV